MQGKNVHITDWKTSQKAYINLHSHVDVTIAGEGMQSLGLCFVLMVWVGRDVYRAHHLWHGGLGFCGRIGRYGIT